MVKYAEVTTGSGESGLIYIGDVASCYLDAVDEIVIDYSFGSKITIAASDPLAQSDVDKIFGVIKSAQEQKWSQVKYVTPSLSLDIQSVIFNFS